MSDIEEVAATIPEEIVTEMQEAETRADDPQIDQFAVPATPTNDFLQIASGGGAIVETQASWAAESGILNNGFPTGIVLQTQYNKAWRQATSWIRALGWHASQLIQQNVLDDGNSEKLWRQLYEAFLVQHVVFDTVGTNSYTTPNTFGLSWTSPPRAGTEISLWITNANTSTGCSLNFAGTGAFAIKHLDGTNPRIGDLAGHVKLSYSSSTWYIDCITMNMLNLRVGGLVAITSATVVYVSPTGNNTTGAGTIGSPWQTLQYAYDRVTAQFFNIGGSITIQMLDGVYTSGLAAVAAPLGSSLVTIRGNASNAALVRVVVSGQNCFTVTANGNILVRDLSLNATTSAGNGGAGLAGQYGGHISFTNVIFEACTFAHIFASFNTSIDCAGNYQIVGNSPCHYNVASGAAVVASGSSLVGAVTVTLTGTLTFSDSFAHATGGAFLYAPANTFNISGSVTGVRFIIGLNAVIDTSGKGVNYFPGSIPWSSSTGGQYN